MSRGRGYCLRGRLDEFDAPYLETHLSLWILGVVGLVDLPARPHQPPWEPSCRPSGAPGPVGLCPPTFMGVGFSLALPSLTSWGRNQEKYHREVLFCMFYILYSIFYYFIVFLGIASFVACRAKGNLLPKSSRQEPDPKLL